MLNVCQKTVKKKNEYYKGMIYNQLATSLINLIRINLSSSSS